MLQGMVHLFRLVCDVCPLSGNLGSYSLLFFFECYSFSDRCSHAHVNYLSNWSFLSIYTVRCRSFSGGFGFLRVHGYGLKVFRYHFIPHR